MDNQSPATEREHLHGENEAECWCQPDMIFEFDGREVWVHKGNGEELVPARIIAEAVYAVLMNRDIE